MKKSLFIFLSLALIHSTAFSQQIQWQKCLGGTSNDNATSIQQTSDGGYILAGNSESIDWDVSGNHGSNDFWVIKLNMGGDTLWTKCLGGLSHDIATSIKQTSDGGYIVAGYTNSNDGDVSGNHGNYDYWVVKLDGIGTISWQKCLGGTSLDQAYSIEQTSDGGYIAAGITQSNNGDVSGNNGGEDSWVVKLDSIGSISWQKCFGTPNIDQSASIRQTSDGGYVMISSEGGIIYPWWGLVGDSVVIRKLTNSGTISWNKSYNLFPSWGLTSIQQTSDGGYIVAGSGGFMSKYVIVKFNGIGDTLWTNSLGGTGQERANSIQQTLDGGYIVAGQTSSNDGDVSGNHGSYDIWVVKLDSTVTTSIFDIQNTISTIQIYPNPSDGVFNIQAAKGELEIYNILGELVHSQSLRNEKTNVDLSDESNGIYYLNLITDKSSYSGKVIIQK